MSRWIAPPDVYDAACRAWEGQRVGSSARLIAAVDAAYERGVAAGRTAAAADLAEKFTAWQRDQEERARWRKDAGLPEVQWRSNEGRARAYRRAAALAQNLADAEPDCSCPDIDISPLSERPGTSTVKGRDPSCPIHRKPGTGAAE